MYIRRKKGFPLFSRRNFLARRVLKRKLQTLREIRNIFGLADLETRP